MRVAVLGAGAWGTAIACAAATRNEVVLFARDRTQAEAMARQRENGRYLPGIEIPSAITVVSKLDRALAHAGTELLIIATPLRALRAMIRDLRDAADARIVWLCKGLEEETQQLGHQIVREELGEQGARRCGPLSGPSFALEVARGLPTALVAAGAEDFCAFVTEALHGGALRIYSTDDVIGVEVGGAVKNVLAIATGVADALELGRNARAALITRGLAEMTRLGAGLGARTETFMGLTGIGDLILTATGELSRNRAVGLALGRGQSTAEALAQLGHVAEGVRSAHAIRGRAREAGIEMPITESVCEVLDGRMSPSQALGSLLARDPQPEVHP